jgi:hypothetical protein
MDSITATKRARNGSVILSDRMCGVTTRVKIYDRKCPGLGVYNPETFTTDDARSTVCGPWTRRRLPRLSASRRRRRPGEAVARRLPGSSLGAQPMRRSSSP